MKFLQKTPYTVNTPFTHMVLANPTHISRTRQGENWAQAHHGGYFVATIACKYTRARAHTHIHTHTQSATLAPKNESSLTSSPQIPARDQFPWRAPMPMHTHTRPLTHTPTHQCAAGGGGWTTSSSTTGTTSSQRSMWMHCKCTPGVCRKQTAGSTQNACACVRACVWVCVCA